MKLIKNTIDDIDLVKINKKLCNIFICNTSNIEIEDY